MSRDTAILVCAGTAISPMVVACVVRRSTMNSDGYSRSTSLPTACATTLWLATCSTACHGGLPVQRGSAVLS